MGPERPVQRQPPDDATHMSLSDCPRKIPDYRRKHRMERPDLLTCNICLEPYDDKMHQAKFLMCHHSFCEQCLCHMMNGQTSIECPTCRRTTTLDNAGIAGLQTNFYIDFMKDEITKYESPHNLGCLKHTNQPLSFFCQKCETAICRDCTVLDHKESAGHTITDISVAESEQREALDMEVMLAQSSLTDAHSHMTQLEAELGNLKLVQEKSLKDVEKAFEGYAKILEMRRAQLTKKITDMYNERQSSIVAMCDTVGGCTKELAMTVDQCVKTMKHSTIVKVVGAKAGLTSAMEKMTTVMAKLDLGANHLMFDSKEGMDDYKVAVEKLGDTVFHALLPSRVEFEPKNAVACLPATVAMKVFSYNDEQLEDQSIHVIIYDRYDTVIESSLTMDSEKNMNVMFTPQVSGNHRFVTTFLGEPIKGTEATITVATNNPVAVYGQRGDGLGKFLCPRAIAIDADGNMYVADTGNKLIQKLDKDGTFVNQFKIDGGNEECSTCDLALCKARGNIICTETVVGQNMNPTMGNTVVSYGFDGTLKHKFVNKVMKCALCVASNSHGEIIVSDYLVHSLFMYDHHGNFLRRIGKLGTFKHPAFISIGENDAIIVSDTNNNTIQVFDREGKFQFRFGKSGHGRGELKQPFGLATDGENIIVVDSGNSRIQVFRYDGTFVSMVESGDDAMNQPRGIAVDQDGHVYVADRDNNCIKKYKYK